MLAKNRYCRKCGGLKKIFNCEFPM